MAVRRGVAADLGDPDQGDDIDVQDDGAQENERDDATDDEADEGEAQDEEIDAAGEDDDGEPPVRQQRQRRETAEEVDERIRVAAERAASDAVARYQATQQTQQQQQAPRESNEQRAARHALMTPEAVMQETMDARFSEQTRVLQGAVQSAANTADKAAFGALVRDVPAWKKLETEVERVHAGFVAQGQYPTRETVLTYVLGQQAMKLAREAKPEQQARARRVAAQRARPVAGRSDVQQQSRRGGKSLEERLENVQL